MKSPGFIGIPVVVSERTNLTSTDKLVYGAMLLFQGKHYHCFASHEKIARRVGCSVRSVVRSIAKLKQNDPPGSALIEAVMVRKSQEDSKVIRFQQRGGADGGKTFCWHCLVPLPETKPKLVSMPRRGA